MKIAILGSESTGKSHLAKALATVLAEGAARVVSIPEALREWCDRQGRTPRAHEQQAIATEQARRIDAVPAVDFLIADTAPLMTAVYSDLLFNDASLYETAIKQQQSFDLTLVMGLDLPWVADGIQRDGPEARVCVDTRLREVLHRHALGYSVVSGSGEARTQCALQAIARHVNKKRLLATAPPCWTGASPPPE